MQSKHERIVRSGAFISHINEGEFPRQLLKEKGYTVVDKLENTYIFKREGK